MVPSWGPTVGFDWAPPACREWLLEASRVSWQNPDILVNVTEDPVAETRTGPGTSNCERYPDPHVRNGVRISLVKSRFLKQRPKLVVEKRVSKKGYPRQVLENSLRKSLYKTGPGEFCHPPGPTRVSRDSTHQYSVRCSPAIRTAQSPAGPISCL